MSLDDELDGDSVAISAPIEDSRVVDLLELAYEGRIPKKERRILKAEIERRKQEDTLEGVVRTLLERKGIGHLDQVIARLPQKKSFWSLLGIEKEKKLYTIHEVQKGLVKLGSFSSRLRDYENPEKIVREILERACFSGSFVSYYFRHSLDAEILRDNRDLLFETDESLKNLKHLDQITGKFAQKRVRWSLLGIEKEGRKEFYTIHEVQKGLVKSGRFSPRLRDYQNPDEIIREILTRYKDVNFSSHYFSQSLDPEILEDNISLLFETVEDLKKLKHLDQITRDFAHKTKYWTLIGIKKQRHLYTISEVQNGLVELERFSPRLRDYENPKEIIREILTRCEKGGSFSSYYFSQSLNPEILNDNIDLLFETDEDLKDLRHLDQITAKLVRRCGLWSLLVSEKSASYQTIPEVQNGLVKLGRFSSNLLEYSQELRNQIFTEALEKRKPHSFYLSEEHEQLESNRRLFYQSEPFQDYLRMKGVSLDELSAVKDAHAKAVFRDCLGIDLGKTTVNPFEGTRRITSIWSRDEEEKLLREYKRLAGELENGNAIKKLLKNKDELQEQFGRSIYAILMKLQSLEEITFIEYVEETGKPSDIRLYPFPRIHEEDLAGYSLRTRNTAYLLEMGLMPEVAMVASYLSPVHEQLVHATVPINYKGIDLKDYNKAERRLLTIVNTYIKNPVGFAENQDSKCLSVPENLEGSLDEKIRIVALKLNGRIITQIIHRRNQEDEILPATNAISTGRGSEIYFFAREETPSYSEVRE